MSRTGVQGTFVNAHGYVHETITVRRTRAELVLIGEPTERDSWFNGFAWTIVVCPLCFSHVGWRFTHTRDDVQPDHFFGLARRSIRVTQHVAADDDGSGDGGSGSGSDAGGVDD
eukprot:CAMPEP_0198367004 /NCGR_PEP_ID=MMETSP1450-20131203/154926_1 /TAXON_ID=753684 ORGANISM="Madagascaria erythrocladiodes, Strain CCMP3234" /NCGR_SAMPLE_ID=MMETSP1450 /ASSEMBLY_ACC=CAM_ASM_001115 /LENGTH=113 /DNA_ID=CAMNT_0044074473 /DNA_START=985 /DNA_END=1326 /DNA_ORIENTATION=-